MVEEAVAAAAAVDTVAVSVNLVRESSWKRALAVPDGAQVHHPPQARVRHQPVRHQPARVFHHQQLHHLQVLRPQAPPALELELEDEARPRPRGEPARPDNHQRLAEQAAGAAARRHRAFPAHLPARRAEDSGARPASST